ncbi:phage scaffolding protein [Psychrobacillus sp. NPDC096389]|uniref:phage scaffolding protein n=1 Tax=Psychrobacillus sp. NPDC096389 TaxID=3364490 RepID=UPI003826EE42
MNKEQLIALGLTEEQANKVIEGYGPTIPKSRFDDVNNTKKQLELDIASRDKQLEELKKVDAAGLQTKITELQQENADAKVKYENDLKETQLYSAIKFALAGKVHDADIAITQIDKKLIELDAEGKVTKGLDEQLKTLQESKPFLFVPETTQTFKGVIPVTPVEKDKDGNPVAGSYGKQLAETSNQGAKELADAQKSYFD